MATLNVKDALSYLDQVKVQFSEHPDVYNRFLDIMKDFKSQSIDTPGVIERVSTLFRGHPSLIQGFNTFLPPGYRIECSLDPSESNMITVTTPTGTTTQSSGGVGIAGAINRMSGTGGPGGGPPGPSAAQRRGPIGRPLSPPPNAGVAPSTPGATAGAGVLSHGSDMGGADAKRAPVEFNHAINYVNKIKQRFSGDPDTYKQFLEILQTYQKEQRPIHDVYAQVTTLFNNDKDLLDEFKQFLPDTSAAGGAPAPGLFGMLGQVSAGLGQPGVAAGAPIDGAKRAGPGASGASRKKRAAEAAAGPGAKVGGGGGAPGIAGAPTTSSKKKSKHHHAAAPGHLPHKTERSPPPMGSPQYAHMPPPLPQQSQGQPPMMMPYGMMDPGMMEQHVGGMGVPGGAMMAGAGGAGGLQQAPNGMPVGGPRAVPLATLDEIAFFDKVKKHIDDRATYLEFLKLLNLYTQDIVDVRTLVDRAALFIGGHRELFGTFKALCGYDMAKHGWLDNEDPIIENVPALQRDKVDLGSCKQYGASYRKLPKSEVNLACSGRDPMCWEVLNDVWVSHPTWASEGEGFNPHKKNVFEDALYRSEEERHEYDYHIEANLRTIALLEPIAARISTMDAEERQAFRLKPGLGGQSKSIYQRVVKKVYGREHGIEVIAALHDNPCVAVPVVLARLKQKDEEWKRAQREWNKVWREVDARNYYKSLDHQGVNFKASDKKAITTKAFVAEIETRRTQQYQRRLATDPSLPRARAAHQLVYTLDDTGVLADVLKLAFSFLDRSNYSRAECERIEGFLRSFVPQLLDLDPADFEELLNGGVTEAGAVNDDEDEDEDDDDARSETATADDDEGSEAGGSARQRKGRQEADLRRKLLRTQAETAASNGATAGNGDVEMAAADDAEDAPSSGAAAAAAAADAVKTWIQVDADTNFVTGGAAPPPVPSNPPTSLSKRCNFFCSTPHYVFVRLLQLLYSRLHKMKSLGAKMASEWPTKTKFNPIALELGLQDVSAGPAHLVGQAAASAAANGGSGDGSPATEESGLTLHPSRYYDTLLDLVEKLFDGDIDQNQYEEAARFMYGIEAYVTFTVDKVVGALVKAAQTITSDSKCQELQSILDKDRAASRASSSAAAVDYKAHISRRMAAEAVVGREENLFRVEFQPTASTMLIQMLGKDDLTLGDEGSDAQQRWQYYIASYALWTPTEGLPAPAQAPFLKRSLADSSRDRDMAGVRYTARNGLEIKVCVSTYRLFFVQDTEDAFARHVPSDVAAKQKRVRASLDKTRKARFSAWLEANNPVATPAETSAEDAEPAPVEGQDGGPREGDGEGESTGATAADSAREGENAAAESHGGDDKMDADNETVDKSQGGVQDAGAAETSASKPAA